MTRQAGNREQESGSFWRAWDQIKHVFVGGRQHILAGSMAFLLQDRPFHMGSGPLAAALPAPQHAPAPGTRGRAGPSGDTGGS